VGGEKARGDRLSPDIHSLWTWLFCRILAQDKKSKQSGMLVL
jgi:hypothetical protein